MSKPTLYYFPIPGRAETARLAFAVGGVEFEDKRVTGEEWGGKMKAEVAPKQMPLLEVNGKMVAQSSAITRYAGKVSKFDGKPLYPEDPMEALLVDEAIEFVAEIGPPLGKTFAIADQAEKEAARAALFKEDGGVTKWLKFLDEMLGKSTSGFVVLDRLTLADIAFFAGLWQLVSGMYDGIPKDALDGFKNIVAHKKKIGTIPQVQKYYASKEGPSAVYKC